VPVIRITESDYIEAETEYLGFPFYRNMLKISDAALNELHGKEGELEALLAHEMWHLKKHTLKWKVLNFLSDYTLFGSGFLAVLHNSYELEKEADAFAKRWLETKLEYEKKASLIICSLLDVMEAHTGNVELQSLISSLTGSLRLGERQKGDDRQEIIKAYDRSGKISKLWINITLVFKMYFEEQIVSYLHPPTKQRKAWINE